MTKFIKLTLLVLILILTDQYSKSYFFNQPDSYFFHKHFNHFFIFGSFASASPEIKYLFIGIIFSTALLFFFLVDFLFFSDQKLVQLGMWTLFAGLTGNMIDKIFLIGVRDFIKIAPNIYTNIADITQWVGFCVFSYAIFKNKDQIWYGKSKRKTLLVNPKEQIIFSLTITLFILLASIAFIFSTLSFFKLLDLSNNKKEIFIILTTCLTILTQFSSFVFCILLSARIWGPLHSFKLYLNNQTSIRFETRKNDFFKDLNQQIRK